VVGPVLAWSKQKLAKHVVVDLSWRYETDGSNIGFSAGAPITPACMHEV
jgi:hypothetical protein